MNPERPTDHPHPSAPEQSQLVRAALQRQIDHVHQHARYQQWDAMLRSLERLEAIAQSSVPHDPVIEAYLAQELPRLQQHFAGLRERLEEERRQFRFSSRRLHQARQLRSARSQPRESRLLLASA